MCRQFSSTSTTQDSIPNLMETILAYFNCFEASFYLSFREPILFMAVLVIRKKYQFIKLLQLRFDMTYSYFIYHRFTDLVIMFEGQPAKFSRPSSQIRQLFSYLNRLGEKLGNLRFVLRRKRLITVFAQGSYSKKIYIFIILISLKGNKNTNKFQKKQKSLLIASYDMKIHYIEVSYFGLALSSLSFGYLGLQPH